jgi:hypothetical protein
MAMAEVVVMMVMRPEPAARRSGGRSQRHGAEGSGGNKSESHFAKHGRSPEYARSTFILARVQVFSPTHRQSVVPPQMPVRGNGAPFADNFLNDYSAVKNITDASKHYYRSGFRPRRSALR